MSGHNSVKELNEGLDADPYSVPFTGQYFARFASVKESPFNARGDGVSDDTAAIRRAIAIAEQAGGNGTVIFPPGEYLFSGTLTFATNRVRVLGAGRGFDTNTCRTALRYAGSGTAIKVTAFEGVSFEHLDLFATDASTNSTTHGISYEYVGSTTSWLHAIRSVKIVGFTGGAGLRYTNNEQTIAEHVYCYGCQTGFYADNSTHSAGPSSGKGINNRWTECRAHACTGNGWDINHQTCGIFTNCQALTCVGTDAQFFLRGGCSNCQITNLDVERSDDTTIGLLASGNRHVMNVNAINLAQGFKGSALTYSVLMPSRFVGNTADVLFTNDSENNRYFDQGQEITDDGTNNDPF